MRWIRAMLVAGCCMAGGAYAEEPAALHKAANVPATQEKATPAVLSTQDKAQLARIEGYLSAIKSISSHFSQVSPDGGISSGKFYLQRPGKMRMEYDPPVPVLVVTNKDNLVYYDHELDQVTNVSLDSTLVGFLARDKVRFDHTVIVTRLEQSGKVLRVTLVQAEHPKDGQMTLEFSDTPLQLRNIIITDNADQVTSVSLSNARFDEALDPVLFVFKDPHLVKGRHIKK